MEVTSIEQLVSKRKYEITLKDGEVRLGYFDILDRIRWRGKLTPIAVFRYKKGRGKLCCQGTLRDFLAIREADRGGLGAYWEGEGVDTPCKSGPFAGEPDKDRCG